MKDKTTKETGRTGGNTPYGYQWKDGELVTVLEETKIYALLFDLFIEHGRKRTVARLLNESGHRTRAGKEFSYSTVARLLENPIAKGERRIRKTHKKAQQTIDGTSQHEWVTVAVEPIVSNGVWNQAQAVIAQQGTQTRRPATHILSGKTYCTCGGKMYVPHKSKNYVCQDCRSKIQIDDLHYIFHQKLGDLSYAESKRLHTLWPDLTLEKQWQIVETVTDRITVGDGAVDLCFYALS